MAEYTSTAEGFRRAMEWSCEGPAEEVERFAEAVLSPHFCHIFLNKRYDLEAFKSQLVKGRALWSEFKLEVHSFVRKGPKLAGRWSYTIKYKRQLQHSDRFFFGEVDMSTGKLDKLFQRFTSELESRDEED